MYEAAPFGALVSLPLLLAATERCIGARTCAAPTQRAFHAIDPERSQLEAGADVANEDEVEDGRARAPRFPR